jgi:hypothetical protein
MHSLSRQCNNPRSAEMRCSVSNQSGKHICCPRYICPLPRNRHYICLSVNLSQYVTQGSRLPVQAIAFQCWSGLILVCVHTVCYMIWWKQTCWYYPSVQTTCYCKRCDVMLSSACKLRRNDTELLNSALVIAQLSAIIDGGRINKSSVKLASNMGPILFTITLLICKYSGVQHYDINRHLSALRSLSIKTHCCSAVTNMSTTG